MEKKALGKGLSALIPEREESEKSDSVIFVSTDSIEDNRLQPRTNYDSEKLHKLKASIKEKGMLQPILVRKKGNGYEVIAGERRLKAVRDLSIEKIPVIIKDVSDQEALVLALVENIQRQELNAMEEAEAYRKLIEDFQFTHENVAQSVSKDRSSITNFLRLLKLPKEIQQSVYNEEISFGHARALLSADSTSDQKKFFQITKKKGLSVRELENLIKAKSAKPYRRQKEEGGKNPQITALEENLQKLLGTKVAVDMKKKRGKIVIEFYSYEDLERIINFLKK